MQDVFAQGGLCFKVLLLKSCTSHDGICVSQYMHVRALKGIEAMSEREGILPDKMVLGYLCPQISLPHK